MVRVVSAQFNDTLLAHFYSRYRADTNNMEDYTLQPSAVYDSFFSLLKSWTCLSFKQTTTTITGQTFSTACQLHKSLQEPISVPMKSWFICSGGAGGGGKPLSCCLPAPRTMNFQETRRNQSYSWLWRTDPMAECSCMWGVGVCVCPCVCAVLSVNCSINSSQAS